MHELRLILCLFVVLTLKYKVVSYLNRPITINNVGELITHRKPTWLAVTPFQAELKQRIIKDELIGADRQMLRKIVRQVCTCFSFHQLFGCKVFLHGCFIAYIYEHIYPCYYTRVYNYTFAYKNFIHINKHTN